MSGSHGAAFHVVEKREDCDSQGCTLGGIRSCSQLVKKAQRTGIRFVQDPYNVGHVGREGTEALLDALFVSDVCKNLIKDSQLRSFPGGNVKSCLSHKGKEANRL